MNAVVGSDAYIKVGLIGHPVAHSKSPLIHNYWIKKYGLQGDYTALDIRPEHFQSTLRQLAKDGFKGLNVTLPFKEQALTLCDVLDNAARQAGAVNTLVFDHGKIHGFNTDIFGFTESITESQPMFDFTQGPAVMLGAGGAAHAVLHALLGQKTPEIIVTNRTLEKARALAAGHAQVQLVPWEQREDVLSRANILINTTALGLEGKEPLNLSLSSLKRGAVVCDIVYSPLYTPLLRAAQDRGHPVVTGIGMLLHQARPAFRKWFGVLPDLDTDLMHKVMA